MRDLVWCLQVKASVAWLHRRRAVREMLGIDRSTGMGPLRTKWGAGDVDADADADAHGFAREFG